MHEQDIYNIRRWWGGKPLAYICGRQTNLPCGEVEIWTVANPTKCRQTSQFGMILLLLIIVVRSILQRPRKVCFTPILSNGGRSRPAVSRALLSYLVSPYLFYCFFGCLPCSLTCFFTYYYCLVASLPYSMRPSVEPMTINK